MDTLLLDGTSWDLLSDASGNIALASIPYAQAQDAASAIRTFQGECYYDTTIGVPYWAQILGKFPPLPLLKAKFASAALTVPGVTTASVYISSFVDRAIKGQVHITNSSSHTSVASF